jgi:Chloride channel protein EriC
MNHDTSRGDFFSNPRMPWMAALAVPVGLLSTLAAFVLVNLIHLFTNLFFFASFSFADRSPAANTLGLWVIAIPVAGGLLIGLIARFGTEKIRGHGIPEAIEAILFGKSRMSPKVAVLKPLASGIAIGSGGPFGAEGPIIMTGGALGSLLAQTLSLTAAERKTLLVAGATAGMTAVFGTPLAAVLLAVELLLFEWRPRSFIPVAVACAVAGFGRARWFGTGAIFPLETGQPQFVALFSCVIAGLLSGMLAATLSAALYKIEDLFAKLPLHWMWWPALAGVVIGVGGYIEPRALGVGYDVIDDLLHQNVLMQVAVGLLVVKAIMWVVALGSGTSGGVLAPLLMLGAGLGVVLSRILPGADPMLWPLVCMTATLGGTLGAPLTAIVFGFELTHDSHAMLPLLAATLTSHAFVTLAMRRSIMTEKIARRGYHIFREYGVDPLERHAVREVMSTQVQAVDAAMSLDTVSAAFFGTGQSHRAFPVVREGEVIGMVDRVALQRWLDAGASRSAGEALVGSAIEVALPSDTCQQVAARMAVHGLERMPVVENPRSRRLVGIVSRSDLVRPLDTQFHEETQRERFWRPRTR